jgi:hypothetical protein
MEGMNQTGVPCNHICKCHNETLVQLLYTNKSVLKKNTVCCSVLGNVVHKNAEVTLLLL